MRRRLALAGAWLLAAANANAAAIGTGLFDASPHILGRVTQGEADEVRRDFAAALKKPLSIDIYPLSDPVEVAAIGLWLQERRPAVRLKGSCVGSCARSVLLSGAVQHIAPGTVIALGGMADFPALVKDQIEAGELFIADNERSQASRERFLQHFRPSMTQATQLRALLAQQAQPPADVQAFAATLTQSWRVRRLSFTNDRFDMDFAMPAHPCLWWVPDATGLRQLGLEVPGYEPVSRAVAAKLLKVPEGLVYVGPALPTLPAQPLCEGVKSFSVPVLP